MGAIRRPTRPDPARFLLLAASLLLFIVACALPAVVFRTFSGGVPDGDDKSSAGIVLLLIGGLGIFAGQFAWLANFPLAVSWFTLLFRAYRLSFVFALLAALIALDTLALYSNSIPADEAGTREQFLIHLQAGFFLWLAAMLLVAAGSVVLRIRQKRANSVVPPVDTPSAPTTIK